MNIISMAEICGSNILSGAIRGQEVLAKLIKAIANEPPSPEPLFLDFRNVDVATASFLRESVITFRQLIRNRRSMLYPVIANANSDVCEELAELARARGETVMTCRLSASGEAVRAVLIGDLDPKQKLTFNAVIERGETDAGELKNSFDHTENIGATAWNNRLASLVALGLIMEVHQGRAKRYKPLFGGVHQWA